MRIQESQIYANASWSVSKYCPKYIVVVLNNHKSKVFLGAEWS